MSLPGPECATCGGILGPGAGCPDCDRCADAARPGRGRGRSSLAAGLAVAVIGVAGAMIYVNWPEPGPWFGAAAPAPPAAPSPLAVPSGPAAAEILERAASRSRLAILRVGEGADARTVVALGRPKGPRDHAFIKTNDQTILGRELIRQAMLIAARDELGLDTRDEVLDDIEPAPTAGPLVEVTSVFDQAGRLATVRRGEGDGRETLLKRDLGPAPGDFGTPGQAAIAAERLSRAGFPEALRALGLAGRPNALRGDGALPAQVEERLARLGFVEHIAALRDLHAAIRADGESTARVGALARGYAQLGVLSEFQWHPAHKAFKARALLYAQRLVARDPASGPALANRAFVKALVGIPREALADAAAARALEKALPAWLGLIEAYAGGDAAGMAAEGGPLGPLAALLRLFSVEYPPQGAVVLNSAREVLAADPECYRAHDTMCRVGGVANLHAATAIGPEILTRSLPAKLKLQETLAPSVRLKLEARGNELDVIPALTAAAGSGEDRGEPSWGVLAHLVRETRFIQVYRRLAFMRRNWSVPTDEYWADVRPFVVDHRYRPFLETLALPPAEIRESYGAWVNGFDPTDLDVHEVELDWSFRGFVTSRPPHDWTYALRHSDDTVRDHSEITLVSTRGAQQADQARMLLQIHPRSAYAMATLVEDEWPRSEPKLPAWERAAGNTAVLLGAIGRVYSASKRFDRAAEKLDRYIRLSPDAWAFELLAANYKAQGDLGRWLATLEDYLNRGEDNGLNFARIRVQIAHHYMGLDDWPRAKAYAEAAAETWAQWAMACASEANEGAGDWEQAELWARRATERYPNTSWALWYLFCNRTGHGDREAANAFAESYLEAAAGRPDLADPIAAAYFFWLNGSTRRAHAAFGALYDANPSASMALPAALLADEAGDAGRRDAILGQLATTLKDQAPKSAAVAGLMRDSLAEGKPLDLAAVEPILASIRPEARGNTEFFVGKFLLNRGRAEAGRDHLRKAAGSSATHDWSRQIAAAGLRSGEPGKQP